MFPASVAGLITRCLSYLGESFFKRGSTSLWTSSRCCGVSQKSIGNTDKDTIRKHKCKDQPVSTGSAEKQSMYYHVLPRLQADWPARLLPLCALHAILPAATQVITLDLYFSRGSSQRICYQMRTIVDAHTNIHTYINK